MTERKERKPSAFEDLARLARETQPRETQLSEDEDANSGMINLAALAAGAFPTARPASVASPLERGQRLMDPPETGAPSSSPMASLPPASQPAATAAARPPSPTGSLPPPTPPPVVLSPGTPDAVSGMTARFPSASVLLHREGVLTPVPLPPPASPPLAAASSAVLAPSASSAVVPPALAPRPGAPTTIGPGAVMALTPPAQPVPEAVNGSGGGLPPKLAPATTPLAVETTRPTAISVPAGRAERAERKRGGAGSAVVWLALAGGMGVGGLGALLALRWTAHPAQAAHSQETENPGTERPAGAAQAQPATLDDPAPATPTPGTAPPSTPPPSAPPTVTVAALTAAPPAPRPATQTGPSRVLPGAGGPAPASAGNGNGSGIPAAVAALLENSKDPAPAASAAPPPEAQPAPGTSPPAGAAGDPGEANLEALMRRAVAGSGAHAAPVPAAPAPVAGAGDAPRPAGNLPQKPALGAVQGAVGAILPATRYCLGPDDPVSRATITFKSDGTVQGVTVSGDAAGQPAEDCIKARLMTTRIPPFASPTFTWTVPVRPAN